MSGVCLRRGREGDREAAGAGGLPLLRGDDTGHGRGEPVAPLLPPSLLPNQAPLLLHLLHQAPRPAVARAVATPNPSNQLEDEEVEKEPKSIRST